MHKVGFIGLGVMGRPMAACLLKKGCEVRGYDVNPDFPAQVEGLIPAGSVAEAVAEADFVITMLPTKAICLETALGPGGVAETARPGTLVLEMSTTSASTVKELSAGYAQKGLSMLDAPVSGGPPIAAKGEMAIMVGGSKEDFDRARPLLSAMGKNVVHVGGIGAGTTIKMSNQVMGAINMVGVAEGLAMAAKAGVDPELVYQALEDGLADSMALRIKGRKMLDRDFEPGARIAIHMKDMVTVMEEAHKMNFPAPMSALVLEMMQSLTAMGLGDSDQASLVRIYEILGNVEVKSGTASTK
jgi:3-hydroxyisobutyrate dehydrogenase and related beta-hydroxyacid dehydrogenases